MTLAGVGGGGGLRKGDAAGRRSGAALRAPIQGRREGEVRAGGGRLGANPGLPRRSCAAAGGCCRGGEGGRHDGCGKLGVSARGGRRVSGESIWQDAGSK